MKQRGPYRLSTCGADCSGTSHGDDCPAEAAYWEAHERDQRRTRARIEAFASQDDAAIRFSLMELD